MFVEQLIKSNRTILGSMPAVLDRRLAINGVTSPSRPHTDAIANINFVPSAPVDTGLLGSTRVNTPHGPVAIKDLSPGQQVIVSSGQTARVSHILPAKKPTSALRIRAPYFGANQDVVIAQNQYLEIQSDIAEYMFGEARVFVPAWVFKDNSKVLFHELSKSDEMYQLQIDKSDGFGVGECHIAPFLTGTKARGKRFLSDAEARAFSTERRIGQYN